EKVHHLASSETLQYGGIVMGIHGDFIKILYCWKTDEMLRVDWSQRFRNFDVWVWLFLFLCGISVLILTKSHGLGLGTITYFFYESLQNNFPRRWQPLLPFLLVGIPFLSYYFESLITSDITAPMFPKVFDNFAEAVLQKYRIIANSEDRKRLILTLLKHDFLEKIGV